MARARRGESHNPVCCRVWADFLRIVLTAQFAAHAWVKKRCAPPTRGLWLMRTW